MLALVIVPEPTAPQLPATSAALPPIVTVPERLAPAVFLSQSVPKPCSLVTLKFVPGFTESSLSNVSRPEPMFRVCPPPAFSQSRPVLSRVPVTHLIDPLVLVLGRTKSLAKTIAVPLVLARYGVPLPIVTVPEPRAKRLLIFRPPLVVSVTPPVKELEPESVTPAANTPPLPEMLPVKAPTIGLLAVSVIRPLNVPLLSVPARARTSRVPPARFTGPFREASPA